MCDSSLQFILKKFAGENESFQSRYHIFKEQTFEVEESITWVLLTESHAFSPQMIFQQPNPGVHYEYILPSEKPAGPQQPSHRPEGYYYV